MRSPFFLLCLFGCTSTKDQTSSESTSEPINSKPEVFITSHSSEEEFLEGRESIFQAVVSDTDHGIDELIVQWSTDQREICSGATPQEDGLVECSIFFQEGETQLVIQVTDPDGALDMATVDFVIVPTFSPEVEITSPTNETRYFTEKQIPFTAIITDAEDVPSDLRFTWESSIDGILPSTALSDSNGLIEDYFILSEGEHAITLSVEDLSEKVTIQSTQILVENSIPIWDAEAYITPTTAVQTNTVLTCSGLAHSPDETAVTLDYVWKNETQETVLGTSSEQTLNPTIVSPTDIVSCTITATDTSGDTISSSAVVDIINQEPSLSNISITPVGLIHTNTELTCGVDITDPDEENISATYIWTNSTQGSTLGTASSITLTPFLAQPNDIVTCTANVTDNYGASDSIDESVTIGNFPPVISATSISPAPSYNTSTLTCVVTAIDDDAEPLIEDYIWRNTTSGTLLGTSPTITLTTTTASRGDEITCEATVADASASSATSSASTFITNRAPNPPVVSLSPNPAFINSVLQCSATSNDPDGDAVTLNYAWSVDGIFLPNTTNTLSNSFAAGENIMCIVTAHDGLVHGSMGFRMLPISNTVPSIDSLTLSPDPVVTNEDLTATAATTDLDGDTIHLTFDWYVDGSLIQSDTSNTLSAGNYTKDETVTVTVTADDGTESTEASTSTVVQNSPPEAPLISLSPEAPEEQVDDLVCSIETESLDSDGDTISYSFSWTVDSVPFSDATDTATTSTVDAAHTNLEEDWVCTVIPNDGDEDGEAAASSVTIEDGWEGELTFTPCGASGAYGPSQSDCDAEYNGGFLEGQVTVSSGMQYWIVPSDGEYIITAAGAQGASGTGNVYRHGGKGAYIQATFNLSEGDEIQIAVGQKGQGQYSGSSGGGGGGSWVINAQTNSPYIIAGGGGGNRATVDRGGCDASTTQYSTLASVGLSTTSSCGQGSTPLGSGGDTYPYYTCWNYSYGVGSGGGGLYTDGTSNFGTEDGGRSLQNGLIGGLGTGGLGISAQGGFGGGGSGRACWSGGGGGGGGYTGGGGGTVAGGGGSFVGAGSEISSWVWNTGDGYVKINKN